MNREEFIENLKKLKINISKKQEIQLEEYARLLIEWNKKFNLTTILELEDIYLKHFYDSICIVKSIDLNKVEKLCDIGTGAGFPGIVIKVFFPHIKVTLIESNLKKCTFLNEVIKKLELKDIEVINERAEIFSKKNKELYDVVTCRAVSHLKVILEIGTPIIKVDKYFIPLKAKVEQELIESKDIIKQLGLKLEKVEKYFLPKENSIRNIPVLKKIEHTNELYPREYNKIIKCLKK